MIENVVNGKVNTSLELLFKTKKINSRYPKDYKPLAKKEKNKASQEYWDGDKNKDEAKFYNPSFANINQFQTPDSKKNKRHGSY